MVALAQPLVPNVRPTGVHTIDMQIPACHSLMLRFC